MGERKELEIQIPFNAPKDRECVIRINPGDMFLEQLSQLTFPLCDQYRIQADAFTAAVRDNTEVPVPLEDSLANTRVLKAIFKSSETGGWVEVGRQ